MEAGKAKGRGELLHEAAEQAGEDKRLEKSVDERKLRGAMGFSMRSGNCAAGDFASERAVKRGRASLVMLDEDASSATKERYKGMCERAGIPCLIIRDMGGPIGKPGRMIAAVTNIGFAKMIYEEYANIRGGVD